MPMNTSKEVNRSFSLLFVFQYSLSDVDIRHQYVYFSAVYFLIDLKSDIDTFLLALFTVSLDLNSKVIKVLFMKAVVL